MRIFVLGLPHTQTSRRFSHCAFTQKAFNLCKMMYDRGHEVVHVGVEVEDGPPCSKSVSCVSKADWEALYGKKRPEDYFDISIDDDAHKSYMAKFSAGMRQAIIENSGENFSSIIAVPWGGAQQTAVADLQQFVVESGIGYKHVWANYRVYESYAWMHFHFGLQNRFDGDRWYDAVIPNAFAPDLFKYDCHRGDYLLYLGRLNQDKGIGIAIDVARMTGHRLKLAGQGDPKQYGNHQHVEYVGPVGVEARRDLLAGAKALFCATRYIGPFEGTAVEAMMSGCPVITTDWGAFSETVLHGTTGYRCRTLEQFEWAVKNIGSISPRACRDWAVSNYSLERVGAMYEEYFNQVLAVKHEGWPAGNPDRKHLDWLTRKYPIESGNQPDLSANPSPVPRNLIPKVSGWEEDQKWEREWWGKEHNEKWDAEIKKQATYAKLMGMPDDLDFGGKSIIDIGCGPVSMLLRAKHGEALGIDPMPMSKGVLGTYAAASVKFMSLKAEEMPISKVYDELWCYNCLQHVEDLKLIFERMNMVTKEIRLFEWINLGPCPGHPQTLKTEMFTAAFPKEQWDYRIFNTGVLHGFGGTALDEYVAMHLIKRSDIKVGFEP